MRIILSNIKYNINIVFDIAITTFLLYYILTVWKGGE
nr:MAG TPA: hypothetical protein [Caudoviricetes sp.]